MFLSLRPDTRSARKMVYYLITANVIVFMLQLIMPGFTDIFELTPSLALSGAYWQFVTYMFLHADIGHIFWNMLALFIFGTILERQIGSRRFLLLYFASGIFSAFFHLLLAYTGLIPPAMTSFGLVQAIFIPMLGASGAVFGALTAFAFLFPDIPLFIFPIPVPIKAKWAIVGFIVFSLVAGFGNILPGIGHFGHLGGIVAGLLIMLYWRSTDTKQRSPEFSNLEFVWE